MLLQSKQNLKNKKGANVTQNKHAKYSANQLIKSAILINILLFYLTFYPAQAQASINKSVAKCATIKGDLERLDCYDKLAKNHKLTPQISSKENTKGNGKWSLQKETNPVDDSKTVFIYLKADSGKGKYGDDIFFVARCKSNKTEAYINWESYLGRETTVLTRIGDNKANSEEWNISSDNKSSFKKNPIAFLKSMLEANKLVAQTTPYNENPITAIFNISGIENAIKPLREECKW